MLVKVKGNPFNISIIQAYAPTTDADDEEIEEFYDKLDQAYKQCKSAKIQIVMGDINAKIGRGKEVPVAGPFLSR
jgi:exonuclease III